MVLLLGGPQWDGVGRFLCLLDPLSDDGGLQNTGNFAPLRCPYPGPRLTMRATQAWLLSLPLLFAQWGIAPCCFTAIISARAMGSSRLNYTWFISLFLPPTHLPCLLWCTHFQMSQCTDLSDMFVCWARNPLLNYSCLTCKLQGLRHGRSFHAAMLAIVTSESLFKKMLLLSFNLYVIIV